MSKNKHVRKGFPVVAYPASEPTSLCPCELTFRYHEARKEATLSLTATVAVDGFNDKHTFVAQYDADNLITATLRSGTKSLPQTSRDRIARNTDPEMMTLSLRLQKPCTLWCPSSKTMTPKPGVEEAFRQLAQLARATEVHVILDYAHVHKNVRGPLKRLASGRVNLFTTGFPVRDYYAQQGLKQANWTIFCPPDAASVPPAYDEAFRSDYAPCIPPPSVEALRSEDAPCIPLPSDKALCNDYAPLKRPNQDSPLSSPPHKRLLREDLTHDNHPSPTECASSPLNEKVRPTSEQDENDFQSRAISYVVQRHLPGALRAFLPTLLPTLFVTPDSSSQSSGPQTPPPAQLTVLGHSFVTQLIAHLQPHIQPQLQHMYDDALDESEQLRSNADAEFWDEVADHKVDVRQIKEDAVGDVQRILATVVDELKSDALDLADELADDTIKAVSDRLGMLEKVRLDSWNMLESLRLKRLAAWENCACECTMKAPQWRCVKWARGSWMRRVGKGGYAGVGTRWRVLSARERT